MQHNICTCATTTHSLLDLKLYSFHSMIKCVKLNAAVFLIGSTTEGMRLISNKCLLCILQLQADTKHQTVESTNTPIHNCCRQTSRDKPLLQLRSEFLCKCGKIKFLQMNSNNLGSAFIQFSSVNTLLSLADPIEQIKFQLLWKLEVCDILFLVLLLLPLSTLGTWCSGVHSQTGCWWGCCEPGGARSAALGPSARSRPPYRPTPG